MMKTLNSLIITAMALGAFAASAQTDSDGMKAGALDKLAAAKSFTIMAERTISEDLAEVSPFPMQSTIALHVVRPDKLHAQVTGEGIDRQLFFDGNEVSYVDAKENIFFTFTAVGNIDGLITAIEEKLGFTLPMADLISSDPKSKIMTETLKVEDLGEVEVEGAKLNLIKGTDEEIAWQAWIDPATTTLKKVEIGLAAADKPSMTYSFKEVNLDADHSETNFAYTPVEGAKVAKITTVSEMAVGTVEGETPEAE